MRLGDELVAVEEPDLEGGEVAVEPAPVLVPRLVVVHVLRKGGPGELLEPDLEQVGPVGVADELHARSSNATAWAARPSPRPVKPSRSVVVARTLTDCRVDSKCIGETATHLVPVRGDARLLADEDAVGADERVAGLADLRVRVAQELERVCALPALVAGREQRADVAETGRAEQGVDERMRDHVAVRVAGEAARMLDRDAAEDERHAVLQSMRVDAEPDAQVRHRAPPAARRGSGSGSPAAGGSWRVTPGPAPDVHRDHAGRKRRLDVVVDPSPT